MNKIPTLRYILLLLLPAALYTSCSRDKFAEMNTNPDDVLSTKPEYEFTSALLSMNSNDFEYYYDYNRAMYYWTQSYVNRAGNPATVYTGSGNLNQRYSNFYTKVGNQLIDVQQLIAKLPGNEQARYVHLRAISGIPLAYYAMYVSDVQGSIAYTQAFKARYTGLLTPVYNTQEALFDTLEQQLSDIVAILKSNPPVQQANLASNDVYYGGDVNKWIKAANSLRLRLAMRLLKRNPDKMKTRVTAILNDDGGLISSIEEDWKFVGGTSFASGGNYNPSSNSEVSGAKQLVDFMWQKSDPRIRILFQKAPLTKDMFDSAKAQGALPASVNWDGQLYRGQFADPGASTETAYAHYFRDIVFNYNGVKTTVRFPSFIQNNLFYNPASDHNVVFPIITYADICFMRAELAARGVTAEDAQTWYYRGIDASLAVYDDMAKKAALADYSALTPAEVTAYRNQPGIQYDAANALEQICVQEYINCFKNQNEAWATIKRTGFPAVNGKILQLETVTVDNAPQEMPRRFVVRYPNITDLNYQNILDAITAMQQEPGFKTPDDITGRVWWDN